MRVPVLLSSLRERFEAKRRRKKKRRQEPKTRKGAFPSLPHLAQSQLSSSVAMSSPFAPPDPNSASLVVSSTSPPLPPPHKLHSPNHVIPFPATRPPRDRPPLLPTPPLIAPSRLAALDAWARRPPAERLAKLFVGSADAVLAAQDGSEESSEPSSPPASSRPHPQLGS